MSRIKRLAATGVGAALLVLGTGAATPASAAPPAPAPAAVLPAAVTAGWQYYFTYPTLGQCQAEGQRLVDEGVGTDYYCNQVYASGYWMWALYYWVY